MAYTSATVPEQFNHWANGQDASPEYRWICHLESNSQMYLQHDTTPNTMFRVIRSNVNSKKPKRKILACWFGSDAFLESWL